MPVPTSTGEPYERRPLRDIAAERIRHEILQGTLAPGEMLNDQDLQDWLGMSRTPIREALNELARIGFIDMAAQRFTRVALPRPERRLFVLQTLGALIGGVVRVTVPALDEGKRSELVALVDAALATVAARDATAHGRAGWALIDAIIDDCPNPVLVDTTRDAVQSLMFQLDITRSDTTTDWEALDEGYPKMRAAFEQDDSIAAELAVEIVFLLGRPAHDE